jgi:hypothetical protein
MEMLYQTLCDARHPKTFTAKQEDTLVALIKAADAPRQKAVRGLIVQHFRATHPDIPEDHVVDECERELDVSWVTGGCLINVTALPIPLKWMLTRFLETDVA